jgi:hypothetical protein
MSNPIPTAISADAKDDIAMIERTQSTDNDPKSKVDLLAGDVPVSPFKDLPRRKALWVFRRAVFYSVLIAWAAIMDGYLISSTLVAIMTLPHERAARLMGSSSRVNRRQQGVH